MVPTLSIDLAAPPSQRWGGLVAHRGRAQELIASYLADLGGLERFQPFVGDYRQAFVPTEYCAEMDAIAVLLDRDPDEVLLANLYYDAFRAILGCTAFAVDTPTGPLHARNLDWWTCNGILSDYSLISEHAGGACPTPYKAVGWPGFVGIFSAVATNRFAVTLNAVLSAEHPSLAPSITMLLRSVFDSARSYHEAVATLSSTPIAADCLLLVTGTREGEMCVIERTSTRSAVRKPEGGLLVVTNDYRALESGFEDVQGAHDLQATACARFDRATDLARHALPTDASDCLRILKDGAIEMDMTVQHMVMQASTGLLEVTLPGR